MADSDADRPGETPNKPRRGGFWPEWFAPRRLIRFFRNLVILDSSVRRIEEEHRIMRLQIADLQRQVTAQEAKLQLLLEFVKGSLAERIDMRAELVVRRLLDREFRDKGE